MFRGRITKGTVHTIKNVPIQEKDIYMGVNSFVIIVM